MSHTSREPSTKMWGWGFPWIRAINPTRFLVQLHDLLPGEHWNPAWQAEVLTQMTLLPLGFVDCWRIRSVHFQWSWHMRFIRYDLDVRQLGTNFGIFRFHPQPAANLWMVNEITDPAGVFSYGGTAEIIRTEA